MAMVKDTQAGVISRHPDILGGATVFAGTRVPVSVLIDHLRAGDPLEVFLDDFPTVSREQAVAFLDLALAAMETRAEAPHARAA
jgi:uncharacterized protein (DUF433 family)